MNRAEAVSLLTYHHGKLPQSSYARSLVGLILSSACVAHASVLVELLTYAREHASGPEALDPHALASYEHCDALFRTLCLDVGAMTSTAHYIYEAAVFLVNKEIG